MIGDGEVRIRVCESRPDVFRQVVLYVLDRAGGLPNFGEKVLHKVLYFIDFDFYEINEESLMGETYIKNKYGPTSTNLKKELDQMEADGVVKRFVGDFHGRDQHRFEVLSDLVPIDLIEPHIGHIDNVLDRHSGKTGKELEDYSHGDIPWLCARHREHLSYESVFYRDDRYSVRDYTDEL